MRKTTWSTLMFDAFELGLSANAVIALRMAKLARGGAAAESESKRMVAEKITAAAQAGAGAAGFGKPERAAGRAMAIYRRRVKANLRRLSKGG